MQSRIYDGPGAVEAGFLDLAVDLPKVIETAMALAGQLASLPGSTYASNKLALRKEALDAMGV